jgi:hypothetical protein
MDKQLYGQHRQDNNPVELRNHHEKVPYVAYSQYSPNMADVDAVELASIINPSLRRLPYVNLVPDSPWAQTTLV